MSIHLNSTKVDLISGTCDVAGLVLFLRRVPCFRLRKRVFLVGHRLGLLRNGNVTLRFRMLALRGNIAPEMGGGEYPSGTRGKWGCLVDWAKPDGWCCWHWGRLAGWLGCA